MTTPCIITVAITGSLPRKKDNPAVPITVNEQVESTHEAFEAGATLVHLHVRNDDGTPTSAPDPDGRRPQGRSTPRDKGLRQAFACQKRGLPSISAGIGTPKNFKIVGARSTIDAEAPVSGRFEMSTPAVVAKS